MEESTQMKLQCLFCNATDFELPDNNYVPQSGEQITCANCGKSNDYDSMMRVATKKAEEWAKDLAEKEISKILCKFKN